MYALTVPSIQQNKNKQLKAIPIIAQKETFFVGREFWPIPGSVFCTVDASEQKAMVLWTRPDLFTVL